MEHIRRHKRHRSNINLIGANMFLIKDRIQHYILHSIYICINPAFTAVLVLRFLYVRLLASIWTAQMPSMRVTILEVLVVLRRHTTAALQAVGIQCSHATINGNRCTSAI